MDGEIETVSDAAFRTYVEIITLSGLYLLDGRVPLRIVRKQCNAKDIDGALAELAGGDHPYLSIDGDDVVVPKYGKWQQTSEQVEQQRETTLKRVRKHRTSDDCNAVTDGVSNTVTSVESGERRVESTELQSEEASSSRAGEQLPASGLMAFTLRELPTSESTPEDYRRTLDRHQARLPRGQIERIVCELAEFKPTKPRDKLHLTLNKWLAKEEPQKGGDRERVAAHSGRSQNGEW